MIEDLIFWGRKNRLWFTVILVCDASEREDDVILTSRAEIVDHLLSFWSYSLSW